jgi:hypothetical protein
MVIRIEPEAVQHHESMAYMGLVGVWCLQNGHGDSSEDLGDTHVYERRVAFNLWPSKEYGGDEDREGQVRWPHPEHEEGVDDGLGCHACLVSQSRARRKEIEKNRHKDGQAERKKSVK